MNEAEHKILNVIMVVSVSLAAVTVIAKEFTTPADTPPLSSPVVASSVEFTNDEGNDCILKPSDRPGLMYFDCGDFEEGYYNPDTGEVIFSKENDWEKELCRQAGWKHCSS